MDTKTHKIALFFKYAHWKYALRFSRKHATTYIIMGAGRNFRKGGGGKPIKGSNRSRKGLTHGENRPHKEKKVAKKVPHRGKKVSEGLDWLALHLKFGSVYF